MSEPYYSHIINLTRDGTVFISESSHLPRHCIKQNSRLQSFSESMCAHTHEARGRSQVTWEIFSIWRHFSEIQSYHQYSNNIRYSTVLYFTPNNFLSGVHIEHHLFSVSTNYLFFGVLKQYLLHNYDQDSVPLSLHSRLLRKRHTRTPTFCTLLSRNIS